MTLTAQTVLGVHLHCTAATEMTCLFQAVAPLRHCNPVRNASSICHDHPSMAGTSFDAGPIFDIGASNKSAAVTDAAEDADAKNVQLQVRNSLAISSH